jgi:hypothetical protein
MVPHRPKDIDVMLMEGSSVGRLPDDGMFETEDNLECVFVDRFEKTAGRYYGYYCYYTSNILPQLFLATQAKSDAYYDHRGMSAKINSTRSGESLMAEAALSLLREGAIPTRKLKRGKHHGRPMQSAPGRYHD